MPGIVFVTNQVATADLGEIPELDCMVFHCTFLECLGMERKHEIGVKKKPMNHKYPTRCQNYRNLKFKPIYLCQLRHVPAAKLH